MSRITPGALCLIVRSDSLFGRCNIGATLRVIALEGVPAVWTFEEASRPIYAIAPNFEELWLTASAGYRNDEWVVGFFDRDLIPLTGAPALAVLPVGAVVPLNFAPA